MSPLTKVVTIDGPHLALYTNPRAATRAIGSCVKRIGASCARRQSWADQKRSTYERRVAGGCGEKPAAKGSVSQDQALDTEPCGSR